ncbi:unnamed protein product [Pylaiella littoralis]
MRHAPPDDQTSHSVTPRSRCPCCSPARITRTAASCTCVTSGATLPLVSPQTRRTTQQISDIMTVMLFYSSTSAESTPRDTLMTVSRCAERVGQLWGCVVLYLELPACP